MPRTDYFDTYDTDGTLLDRIEVAIPDPAPTPDARIAALEKELVALNAALDAVSTATDFAAAKQALSKRADPALPVKGVSRG